MEEKFKELEEAKNNVEYLLKESYAMVDFHGIVYWAQRVETLREEIKNNL